MIFNLLKILKNIKQNLLWSQEKKYFTLNYLIFNTLIIILKSIVKRKDNNDFQKLKVINIKWFKTKVFCLTYRASKKFSWLLPASMVHTCNLVYVSTFLKTVLPHGLPGCSFFWLVCYVPKNQNRRYIHGTVKICTTGQTCRSQVWHK